MLQSPQGILPQSYRLSSISNLNPKMEKLKHNALVGHLLLIAS
ncbi:Hypothetical protein BN2458_PEG0181 [Helicobacter typhlonius]|uniref:Uncharacterized protein n=1 Tax=Helicobacter typhlonius TaxID=76936 RepID=A0A0S4PSP9_9HELI|nr:Hypothetical protein BN2458_PEG0181 [Helicobacter typhlonius]